MAQGLVDVLGDAIAGGVLITKTFPSERNFHLPDRIEIFKGNHPIPGEDSLRSTKKLLEYCRSITKRRPGYLPDLRWWFCFDGASI